MPTARRVSKSIPPLPSKTFSYEINDYSLGYNSFLSNDKFPLKDGGSNLWKLAQDARINTLGEYVTRKGFDYYSAAAGKTENDTIISTTGASDQPFDNTTRLAQVFTSTVSQRLNMIELNIKNDASATGTIIVEIWSDTSSNPGVLLATSSIASSAVSTTYGYIIARFAEAPLIVTSTNYWIVVYVQDVSTGSYKWSSTTTETTGLSSTDSGITWSTNSFALNFKETYATSGGIIGLHRAYKSDGTKITLFAQGTVLYSVNDSTGDITSVKTGLNSSATYYRFTTVNDVVYYVNGFDGLRKWDFTTESQVNTTNYSLICSHKGLLFLVPTLDKNAIVYSNFGEYEVFTSTDLIYADSPNTGDPIVALRSLNGYLIVQTLDNKFILSGNDNATFSIDEAPDQKGTFTQETIDSDVNSIYYLSDDGVYQSNGSEAKLLSSDIYQEIVDLPNKEKACIVLNKGRLYLWVTPSAETSNSKCYVFSLNYGDNGGTTESYDTNAFVSRAVNGFRDDDKLIVGSSRVGQVYYQELSSNDYSNLGGIINFELRTHYMVGMSPAVLKEVRDWQPRFGAQSGSYTINCQYAYDLRNNWTTYFTPNVQGSGITYGSGHTYGNNEIYGTSAETQVGLYIPGEYRRFAIRYKHYAARQPHKFLGHTLVVQARRLR